jgi:hypothetical protein
MTVNWKKIFAIAVALLGSELLVGFVEGGFSVADPSSARVQFLLSVCASFLLASAIFFVAAARQGHRSFLHASLALLIMVALSLLAARAWLGGEFHMVLAAVEWFTLVAALVVGTTLGIRAGRRARATAG